MQIQFRSSPVEQVEADALAVICFETEESQPSGSETVSSTGVKDPALAMQSGWLAELRRSGEFTGKLYDLALLYRPEGLAAK